MSLSPADYVGWTVTVHENPAACDTGVFYCTGVVAEHGSLILARCGAPREECGLLAGDPTWWIQSEYCTRLRQGDFAQ